MTHRHLLKLRSRSAHTGGSLRINNYARFFTINGPMSIQNSTPLCYIQHLILTLTKKSLEARHFSIRTVLPGDLTIFDQFCCCIFLFFYLFLFVLFGICF